MTSYNDYSIASYGAMIRDARRTGPFVEALRQAIKPGSVVLDIGTGTGIFAFLACQFGAARVYAIEPDPAIELARVSAKTIPGAERIVWIQGLSTEIDLPEQVDVVVGDLHGVMPFFRGNLESMADARKRHLKPGGRMIPARDVLLAVPAQAHDEYLSIANPWRENDYGLDLSAGAQHVFNQWRRAKSEPARPEHLLSGPQTWGEVPYATADIRGLEKQLHWEIERAGTMHGLYVWFEGDLGNGIGYSNAPQLPELVYGRAFFPFEQPTDVVPGDRLDCLLSVRSVQGEFVYQWKSRITSADGSLKASFDQSTFHGLMLDPATLRKGSADYVPSLNQEGQVARAVLQAMAQGRSLRDIADALMVEFPQKYSSADKALAEVAVLSKKYG
ncbi:MAG: class I SAM-dependent methyltransferase [Arenimonas sp.]|nr:class I SAM-dependent methyltransferase [Arenimonas sp.]